MRLTSLLPVLTSLALTLLAPATHAQQQQSPLEQAVQSAVKSGPQPKNGGWTSTVPQAPATQDTSATLGRGSLPGTQVINLPPATKGELAEASNVGKICSDGNGHRYYDCDCVSLSFLQMRVTERAQGLPPSDGFEMKIAAQKACPNTPSLAGHSYNVCMSWAPRMHENYEELCSCYASAYAQKFGQNPTDSFYVNQQLMSAALKSCNAGQATVLKLQREKRIRQLKRDGTYDQLFPSARESGLATTLPEKQPVLSTTPPTQRLTDQILGPGTAPRIPDRSKASGQ